jgi:hypothetical protein
VTGRGGGAGVVLEVRALSQRDRPRDIAHDKPVTGVTGADVTRGAW